MSETGQGPAPEELFSIVGAVVFASDEPVQPKEIAAALAGVEVQDVERAIGELEAHCERHALGLRLERIAGGVRLATSSSVAPWVRHFFRLRHRTRLSPAALETLAIVAYRQPVTMPEIQAIRGKDPTAAMRGLLDRKLVRCLGRKKVVGSPMLYGTCREFLVHFGLNSLDDLPTIEDFDQFLGVLEARQGSVPEGAEEAEERAGDA